LSTTGSSTKSMAYPIVMSTSTSHSTTCFLMGAHGPCGSLEITSMMPWRMLLTWCSSPYACSTCLTPRACLSRCTRSRTTPTQSGRCTLMRRATSFRTTTMVVGHTWQDMLSTSSSCSTIPSALLQDSVVILALMQGMSHPLSRRLSTWA
jgi:hypothetical protein